MVQETEYHKCCKAIRDRRNITYTKERVCHNSAWKVRDSKRGYEASDCNATKDTGIIRRLLLKLPETEGVSQQGL
jgi:hypothetical protein